MSEEKSKLIGVIKKSNTEQIQVKVRLYKDILLADARIWYITDEGWAPTRKGLSFTKNSLEQIIPMLQQILDVMNNVKKKEETKEVKEETKVVTQDKLAEIIKKNTE